MPPKQHIQSWKTQLLHSPDCFGSLWSPEVLSTLPQDTQYARNRDKSISCGGFEPQTLGLAILLCTLPLSYRLHGRDSNPRHHNPSLNNMLSFLEYSRHTVQHAVGTAGQEVTSNTRALSNIPQHTDSILLFGSADCGVLDHRAHPFTTPTVFSFLTGVTISSCCAMTWSISL